MPNDSRKEASIAERSRLTLLIVRNRYSRVVALTVIAVLLIALTSNDYSFASRNPLVDELDDTVNMLALIIQKAEKSKGAHPAFLVDLKEILAGLEALPESFDEFAASKVETSTAKEIRVEASTQTSKKAGGNSWFGALLKVVEEVISLPDVIGELGSAIKEITTKPDAQPDTEVQSVPAAPATPAGSASHSMTANDRISTTTGTDQPTAASTGAQAEDNFLADPTEVEKVSSNYAKNTNAQSVVLESLIAQGSKAIYEIIPYLESDDSRVVDKIIEALETMGSGAAPAVPALAAKLSTIDSNSKSIIQLLAELGSSAQAAVPALVHLLDNKDLAAPALAALVAIDSNPEPWAYPQLISCLDLSQNSGGRDAEIILTRCGEEAVPALIDASKTGKLSIRTQSIYTLGQMKFRGLAAVEYLKRASLDRDAQVRREAIRALSKIDPTDHDIAYTIAAALMDDDEEVVVAAALGMALMINPPDELLDDLLSALKTYQANERVASRLARAIGVYGPKAVPTLINIVEHDLPGKEYAISTLGEIGPQADAATTLLMSIYKDSDPDLQEAVVTALGGIGNDRSFDLLCHAYHSGSKTAVKVAALYAISKFSSEASTEVLLEALNSGSSWIFETAVAGLSQKGESVIEPLCEMLHAQEPKMRFVAIATLGEMGIRATPALPYMEKLIEEDPDERIRSVAEEGMNRIITLANMDLPLVQLPDYKDINELCELDWEMAVLATMELMRSILGEMSPEETNLFEKKWEPFFRYPSQDMVDYLKQLNPLLMKFSALRAAFVEAAYGYEGAIIDASTAQDFGAEAELEAALYTAEHNMTLIHMLQREMAIVAKEIDELGPLPDPEELQARARRRLQNALTVTNTEDLDQLARESWQGGSYWVLVSLESDTVSTISGIGTLTLSSAPPGKMESPSSIVEGAASGSEMGIGGDFNGFESSGSVSWTPLPRLLPEDTGFRFPMKVKANFSTDKPDHEWLMTETGLAISDGGEPNWRVWVASSTKPISADEEINLNHYVWRYEREETGLDAVNIVVKVQVPGAMGVFNHTYELQELDSEQVQALVQSAEDEKEKQKAQIAMAEEEFAEQYEAAHQRLSAVAFQREQAEYFKEQMQHLRKSLQTATDPQAVESLTWQLMVTEANHQGALDEITFAETGEWTRTPTTYDSYVSLRMAEQSRELADEFAERTRILNAIPRQLALAPSDLRETLTRFVDRNLNVGDLKQMRDVARIVSDRVQAHWEGEAAHNSEIAAIQDENIFWAQSIKMGAGMLITGGASSAVTALGGSAKAVAMAPTATKLLYGGTTGYFEGGPKEAVKQTIAWSHQVGGLAIEAYEGFEAGSKEGLGKGLSEAAWRAGQAYVMDKVIDYGTHLAGRAISATFDKPKPSVHQQFDAAKYREDIDNAKNLVKHWQDKQWELSTLTASGVPSAKAQQVSNELTQLVSSINSSYHAKWLLKHQSPPHVQALFNNRLNDIYSNTMPDFYGQLKTMGYDTTNLRFCTMRNASNVGSVGMDLDLALDETSRVIISKNGEQVSRFVFMDDAQKAWNRAYMQNTGYSAVQSDILITTGAHREAFADTALLSKNIDFGAIKSGHIQQAGDVFRTKVQHSLQSGTSEIGRTQAVCRDIEKEMRTKVLPYMEYRIKQEALRGNRVNVTKLQETNVYWKKVYEKVNTIGRQETNPYKIWQMQRELETMTGHKTHQVMEQLAGHFETLGKFYQ
ncbi:MAG: HEAT repeat domain-containing protein [Bacillota bacterium]